MGPHPPTRHTSFLFISSETKQLGYLVCLVSSFPNTNSKIQCWTVGMVWSFHEGVPSAGELGATDPTEEGH